MSRAHRFVELWNEGRVEEALGETSPDYSYADPTVGRVDRDGHLAVMERIFDSMPDRRITVHRTWVADGAEFLEYTWRGTTPAGEVIERDYFAIFEFDEAGRASRQRHLEL